jgi:hypothetical protein
MSTVGISTVPNSTSNRNIMVKPTASFNAADRVGFLKEKTLNIEKEVTSLQHRFCAIAKRVERAVAGGAGGGAGTLSESTVR